MICTARQSESLMIWTTLAPKAGFKSPFGTIVCNANHINAGHEPRPEVEAEHKLEGVGSMPSVG
jgi:hypothetical protein